MKILTFDTEEWYTEMAYHSADKEHYKTFDRYLKSILDLLDEQNLKATFFCVGGLATYFPDVVRTIAEKGHEIGCHSNVHKWLSTFDREGIYNDTHNAISALEDLIGNKVISYRAPAFSIGEKNKWAFEVLAECGIKRDASIYPAIRDFGGFDGFPAHEPCIIKVGDTSIKEFPICLTKVLNRELAYSGGGYFRFFPYGFINKTMRESDYAMTYFHIDDLVYHPMQIRDKESYERIFKVEGTLKRRCIRMVKDSLGTKGAFDKMCKLVKAFDYVNIDGANKLVDWKKAPIVKL